MNGIKKIRTVTCLSAMWLALAGCQSTENTFLDDFHMPWSDKPIEVAKAWKDEPLITENQCDTFSPENISSFMQKYYQASLVGTVTEEKSGQRALENYFFSAVLINRANLCLAETLGLEELLDDLHKEKEILAGGTSINKEDMEKHRLYSQNASIAISEKVGEIEKLSPEQKKVATIGITAFLGGSYTSSRVLDHTEELVKKFNINKGGTFQQMWDSVVKTGSQGTLIVFVYNGMTEVAKTWWDTGSNLYQFSVDNDIELPADATAMFRNMRQQPAQEEQAI